MHKILTKNLKKILIIKLKMAKFIYGVQFPRVEEMIWY